VSEPYTYQHLNLAGYSPTQSSIYSYSAHSRPYWKYMLYLTTLINLTNTYLGLLKNLLWRVHWNKC